MQEDLLLAELIALRAEVAALREENATLSENQLIQLHLIKQLREAGRKEPTIPPQGTKTLARISKIDEVLKARGPTTLKELERILKISPKEMNRLLTRLDMRRYNLHARPGDGREKVLRLKVQIR